MSESPNYHGMIEFLMKPFLGSPEHLKINIEALNNHRKVWLRVAFAPEDRGRMFGRGGRNIQAIRTVLEATAALYDQRVSLEVYGESAHHARSAEDEASSSNRPRRPRRPERLDSSKDRNSD